MYHVPLTQEALSASNTFSRLLAKFNGSAFLTTSHGVIQRNSSSVRGDACLDLLANLADASVRGSALGCHHGCREELSLPGFAWQRVWDLSGDTAAVISLICPSHSGFLRAKRMVFSQRRIYMYVCPQLEYLDRSS